MSRPPEVPAIELSDVAVCYRVPHERVSGFKEYAIRWLQGRIEYVDFWALRGVGLTVYPGETVGIVGPNGAGKTTLLKTVARVLAPGRGRVVVRGHLAPLLELGAGFHPELTGRENVFLYGALLGHARRDMQSMFDAIVDFAGVRDFIDSPLRVYSSGMASRLGFAVATCRRPDILLIDEVLAVGDAAFQEKCLARLEAFRSLGTAILFVSHNPETVKRLCSRSAWLTAGLFKRVGPAQAVVDAYLAEEAGKASDESLDLSRGPEPHQAIESLGRSNA